MKMRLHLPHFMPVLWVSEFVSNIVYHSNACQYYWVQLDVQFCHYIR